LETIFGALQNVVPSRSWQIEPFMIFLDWRNNVELRLNRLESLCNGALDTSVGLEILEI
jgi:hypothetical protein